MLSNPEVTGRLLKWRFELEEHDIHYIPRTSVKGQILADFIVERPKDASLDTPMKDKEELMDPWILFTDGSSSVDDFEASLIIMNPKGIEFTYALRFRFDATNNEAEYEALIACLRIAEQMGELGMIKYLEKVKNLTSTFKEFSIKQVPMGENKKADALSKMTSTSFAHLSKQVLVDEKKVLAVVKEEGRTWMTPIYEYLTEKILPEEKRKERAIRRKAGVMQHARRPKIHGGKSSKIRILLANYARRGQEIDKGVQKLSGSSSRAKEPATKLDPYRIPVAILQIEDRHSWTFPGRSRNGETPFSLTYGTKAMIQVEISMPTLRTAKVDMIKKDKALEINLDILEERREQATIQEAKSKAKMENTITPGSVKKF
nr:reverse transcriptase domain-containing protein [Tanacetum cinerariifolium]